MELWGTELGHYWSQSPKIRFGNLQTLSGGSHKGTSGVDHPWIVLVGFFWGVFSEQNGYGVANARSSQQICLLGVMPMRMC